MDREAWLDAVHRVAQLGCGRSPAGHVFIFRTTSSAGLLLLQA